MADSPSPAHAGICEPETAQLAKHQACGCVICTCEDEEQCHGCGAKNCGTHPVGKFPNPTFAASPDVGKAQAPSPDVQELHCWKCGVRNLYRAAIAQSAPRPVLKK